MKSTDTSFCRICGTGHTEKILEVDIDNIAAFYGPFSDQSELRREIKRLYELSGASASTGHYCLSCGHISIIPLMLETSDFYKLFYRRKRDSSSRPEFKIILDDIKNTGNCDILCDIGAGEGLFLKSLGKNITCLGIEPGRSNSTEEEYSSNIKWFPLVSDIPVEYYSKIDYLTLFQTLEHLPDPAEYLKHLRKLLRRGGVLALSVPSSSGNKKLFEITGALDVAPVHFNYFSEKSLTNILETCGYKIKYIQQTSAGTTEIYSALFYKYRNIISQYDKICTIERKQFRIRMARALLKALFTVILNYKQLSYSRTIVAIATTRGS